MSNPVVFISYAHQKGLVDFIDSLKHRLTMSSDPIATWRDRDNILAGARWDDAIDRAIDSCDAMIVIVTPESNASPYVTYEWSYAFGKGKPVLPLLFMGTTKEMHDKLSRHQLIDFSDEKRPWDELVRDLKAIFVDRKPTDTLLLPEIAQDTVYATLEPVFKSPLPQEHRPRAMLDKLLSLKILTPIQAARLGEIYTKSLSKP
ncbi:MAG: toll/interleukin-1 receptor domain-containing protein [Chloroflexota bacterium]|nr:toll/interleukin-1 receptor domain-containing protein [Chloroflexota bacterium]